MVVITGSVPIAFTDILEESFMISSKESLKVLIDINFDEYIKQATLNGTIYVR